MKTQVKKTCTSKELLENLCSLVHLYREKENVGLALLKLNLSPREILIAVLESEGKLLIV